MVTFRPAVVDFCREADGRENRGGDTELCGKAAKREAVVMEDENSA